MKTERLPIDQIKENPRNPRKIDEEKFKKLVQRIEEFPKMMEVRPLVLDENNMVLGGNMRLKALKELGWKDAPIKRADNFTEEEKKQFVVIDNLGYGMWDYDILGADYGVEELEEWGFETKSFGFDKEGAFGNKEIEQDELGAESKLVFVFEKQDEYLNILDGIERAKRDLNLESNEDLLIKLLEQYV